MPLWPVDAAPTCTVGLVSLCVAVTNKEPRDLFGAKAVSGDAGSSHLRAADVGTGMANDNAALLLMKQLKGARAVAGTRPPL